MRAGRMTSTAIQLTTMLVATMMEGHAATTTNHSGTFTVAL